MKHLRRYIARTVVINTPEDVFKGTLVAADRDGAVIDHVMTLGPSGGPLDGTIVVPTHSVLWAQVV